MEPFVPEFLPISSINWEANARIVGEANRSISRYDGLLQGIPDPGVMLSPLTVQEAVLSSRIEGTRATLGDVLKHDAGDKPAEPERQKDIYEIVNYRQALLFAKNTLKERQFSLSLLKETHQRLMSSVRGSNKNPGKFRATQNWIGAHGTPIEEAFFVPPAPHLLTDYLQNFIEYYHSDRPDPLVQLAVLHAQFEIIHPFDDGNGRLGRMIIPLYLYEKKVLSEPMFYLSGYFDQKKDEYVQHLRSLNHSADAWNKWIVFFMRAIQEQAEHNTATTKSIMELYTNLKKEALELTSSRYTVPILDYIFANPYFRPAELAKRPDMPTRAQLSSIFDTLKQAGIVTVHTHGKGRRAEILLFPSLLNICEGRPVFYDPREDR